MATSLVPESAVERLLGGAGAPAAAADQADLDRVAAGGVHERDGQAGRGGRRGRGRRSLEEVAARRG